MAASSTTNAIQSINACALDRTINAGLQVVRQILNLATEWMDMSGLTWLAHAPKIRLLPESDRRSAYPLSWEEQDKFCI